ncbi:MAG: hypothetical protein LUC31_03750 [Coprobacillus sp.]|nr:hypothetical protein [Coprobacillus sp.]
MTEEENKTIEKKSTPSWLNGLVIGLFVIGIILIFAGAIYESTINEDTTSDRIQAISIVAAILIVVGILLIIPFIVVRTRPGRLQRKANKAKEDERRSLDLEVQLNLDRSKFNTQTKRFQEAEKNLSKQEKEDKNHTKLKELLSRCYEEINLATRAFNEKNLDMVEKHLGQFETLILKVNKYYPTMASRSTTTSNTNVNQPQSRSTKRSSEEDDSDVIYPDVTTKQDHEFFEEEIEDAELFDELDEMGDWFDDNF